MLTRDLTVAVNAVEIGYSLVSGRWSLFSIPASREIKANTLDRPCHDGILANPCSLSRESSGLNTSRQIDSETSIDGTRSQRHFVESAVYVDSYNYNHVISRA
jgi:hypothetical protein